MFLDEGDDDDTVIVDQFVNKEKKTHAWCQSKSCTGYLLEELPGKFLQF